MPNYIVKVVREDRRVTEIVAEAECVQLTFRVGRDGVPAQTSRSRKDLSRVYPGCMSISNGAYAQIQRQVRAIARQGR